MSEEAEQAQNQEAVISENEHSPDFQRYRKRSSINDEDQEVLSASSDGVQVNLTRSNASVGPSHLSNFRNTTADKQPYRGYNKYLFEDDPMEEDDDNEDKDLAWYFKKFHPDIDKYRQIAWCRTYANCLAAQIPKARPKTYKKKAKTEENIYKIKGI